MAKLTRRYPGIVFRGVGKNSRYIFQLCYLPFPKKRVYKNIRLQSKSYREAEDVRSQWISDYKQKHPYHDLESKKDLSFEGLRDVLLKMMESSTLNNRAEPCAYSTINKTSNIFDRFFLGFLGKCYPSIKHISQLPKGVFLDYLSYNKTQQELNWRTELGHLKAIISRLWRADYCDDRIYKEIRTLPTPKFEIKNKVVLTLDEKKAILGAMESDNYQYYVITYLLAKLGWRINETLSIKRGLIRWRECVPVSITIEKPFRKNRREFTLATIDKKLSNMLIEYTNRQKSGAEWLFPNSRGNMIKKETYRNYLHKVSRRVLQREVNPHDFRHSLITQLKASRVPNKDIMQITGHMDERVLNDHYSHSTESGRMEALLLSGI